MSAFVSLSFLSCEMCMTEIFLWIPEFRVSAFSFEKENHQIFLQHYAFSRATNILLRGMREGIKGPLRDLCGGWKGKSSLPCSGSWEKEDRRGVGKEVFSAWFILNLGFFYNNISSSMLFPYFHCLPQSSSIELVQNKVRTTRREAQVFTKQQ